MATMPYKSLLITLFMSQRENLLTIVVLEIWPNLTHFFKNSKILKNFEKFFSDFSKFSLYYVILSIKIQNWPKNRKKNFQKFFEIFKIFLSLLPIGLRKHLENFWKNFQKIGHFSKTTHLTKMATMPYKSLLIALLCRKGKTCSLL